MYADVAGARRYTLVIGAGVNANRNMPGWSALVQRAWREVFGENQHYRRDVAKRLSEARSAVRKHCGWSDEEAQRLDVAIHPLEPQFALELIDHRIREDPEVANRIRRFVGGAPAVQTPESLNLLPALLAGCLYEHVRRDGTPDTLSELARFIRRSKRLVRVISLNVDNLLEIEVEKTRPQGDHDRFLQVISRERHRPGHGIPTYHLHGFLPINLLENVPRWAKSTRPRRVQQRIKSSQDLEHMTEVVSEGVVFTDAHYWRTVATPLSFANYVFANALHDSSCIFIGLSMTDLNVIRWLGLYAAGFRREYDRELRARGLPYEAPGPYTRHCWIRSRSADASGLITSLLARRGVHTEVLGSWRAPAVRKVLAELLKYDPRG
jgi:hypothetical protein